MQAKKRCSSIWAKMLMAMLSVALVFTMMPLAGGVANAAQSEWNPDDIALVVYNNGVDGDPIELKIDEIKALNTDDATITVGDKSIKGVTLGTIIDTYKVKKQKITIDTVDYDYDHKFRMVENKDAARDYILAYEENGKAVFSQSKAAREAGVELYGCLNLYKINESGELERIQKLTGTITAGALSTDELIETITITGNALETEKVFANLDALRNDPSVLSKVKEDVEFRWKNSDNSTGTAKVTGITIEDLIALAGKKENMQITKINVSAADGQWDYSYDADTLLKPRPEKDGNLAMYAWIYELWSDDGSEHKQGDKEQRIVFGQSSEGDINQPAWGKQICKIEVIGEEKASEPEETTKPEPAAKVIPKAPKIKTQSKGAKNAMIVSWGKVKNATSYKVMYRKAGSKWATKATKGTTLWIKGLKKGNMYEVKAIAVGKDGKSKASNVVYRYYKPAYNVKLKAKKKAVRVSWKKDAKATGYQVFCSTSKNMKNAKKVTVKGKTKCTISKLIKGKRYYVKVRPYITKNGHTYLGTMSRVKSVKTR